MGDGVPGLGPGARQLHSASVHPRPDVSRGEGQSGPGVDQAGDSFESGAACVSKLLKGGQVARSACLGYRFSGAAECRPLRG